MQEEGKQTSASDGSAVDRISDLHDDLLLHVLGFLPDARDLVQTAAVSRRWRHLWTRAPVLTFWNTIGHPREVEDAHFYDFIHAALARRTVPIDQLVLNVYCNRSTQEWPGTSRLNLWLGLAMHHVVNSLDVTMWQPWYRGLFLIADKAAFKHLLLPDRSRATEISLDLGNSILKLPSTVAFHELTHLSLSSVSFLDGDGDHLCRLLSSPSCFPRLRKLSLSNLGLEKLQLYCSALEFLELSSLVNLIQLDVDAPRLSALTISTLTLNRHAFSVRAPALKEIKCSLNFGYDRYFNTILLMQRCTSAERHTVLLHVPSEVKVKAVVDDVKTYLPQLAHVKDVTLILSSGHTHNFVATAARFVARCRHLQHLRLHIPDPSVFTKRCEDEEFCTCALPERWLEDDDMIISLEHLREVEMSGFYGWDCHDMMRLLLAAAPTLQRMTVTCKQGSPSLPATCIWGSGPPLVMRISTSGFDRQ